MSAPSFSDAERDGCPHDPHSAPSAASPVYWDEATHTFVITRYDDVRSILLDPTHFSSDVGGGSNRRERGVRTPASQALRAIYERHGIAPAPNLSTRDDPAHRQVRQLLDAAFRPGAVQRLELTIARIADELIEGFVHEDGCEFVSAFAGKLPLLVITQMIGLPERDVPQYKIWTDAWIDRMGLMRGEDELEELVEREIEAREYFAGLFSRLRTRPDGTLLSRLVNTPVHGWGRRLTDEELFAEVMSDLLVGGSETTAYALVAGVLLLTDHPDLWQTVARPGDPMAAAFTEEVLRLASPVQGLLRVVRQAATFHGVRIPAGSIVNLRYAAANRDEREFRRPEQIDLQRNRPKRHLALGVGVHHCLGASLARTELQLSFQALTQRFTGVTRDPSRPLAYAPNLFVRVMREAWVRFAP